MRIRYQAIEYNKQQAQKAIAEGKKRRATSVPSISQAATIAGEFIARRNNGHSSSRELEDITKYYKPKYLEERKN